MSKRKKRVLPILTAAVLAVLAVFFFFPRSLLGSEEPIQSVTVIVADQEPGKITQNTYIFEAETPECRRILDCLKEYSHRYSFGTVKCLATQRFGMSGNDAGYWLHIYLDTASGRRVLICGGTGEIMVDAIVCRMGIAGNRRQLAMMEAIRAIVEEQEEV